MNIPRTPGTRTVLPVFFATLVAVTILAQSKKTEPAAPKKESPQPRVVTPGNDGGAPSDAVVLFDGKDLSHFRGQRSAEPKWKVENGVMETTPEGGIFSREEFGDCQLHIEWAAPTVVKGQGQGRGNSGIYLMGRYEIQILDSFENQTYPDGQCGAFYGRNAPLANVCRPPGEWQSYDIIFRAPKRGADGVIQPGAFTVLHNGVLIQDHIPVEEKHTTAAPLKEFSETGPLYLQDHGNPVAFPQRLAAETAANPMTHFQMSLKQPKAITP